MNLYLDSAYVAKCYLTEPDSARVRQLISQAETLCSSSWCIAELACTLQRHLRERLLTRAQARQAWSLFRQHVSDGVWILIPVTEPLLFELGRVTEEAPAGILLRAGDAVHLLTAREAGFKEIWSNDRRLLEAAKQFGLQGKSV